MPDRTVIAPRWHRRWLVVVAAVQIALTGPWVVLDTVGGEPFDLGLTLRAALLALGVWLLALGARQGVIVDATGLHQRRLRGPRELARWEDIRAIDVEDDVAPVAVLRGGDTVRLFDVNDDVPRVVAQLQEAHARHLA